MKKSVCIDVDGVLAQYDGWKGPEHIGDPIPGAVAFTKELSKVANVIIHTTRSREEGLPTLLDWLQKNEFFFEFVHTGPGKPIAAAYIDDRAVPCRPQDDGQVAFMVAYGRVLDLIK